MHYSLLTERDSSINFFDMRKTNLILLASTNHGKIQEYKSLFESFYPQYELKALDEIIMNPKSLGEAETGKTYEANAFNKAKLAHLAAKYPTLSDDTGLEVNALQGAPGVYSARYCSTLKAGQTQDQANVEKLLEALAKTTADQRQARFVCHLTFMMEGVVLNASGFVEGKILEQPRGDKGFGYDAIFQPQASQLTFAEMTLNEKNRISHRFKALQDLFKQIEARKLQLVRP